MVQKFLGHGINYNGSDLELKGCIPDVLNHLQVRIERYGLINDGDHVLILSDAKGTPADKLPTGDNMIRSFDWLLSGVKEGDHLIYHYSGHGTQVETTEKLSSEKDGFDEALVPLDYEENGVLLDNLLYKKLVSRVPKGVKLLVLIDACHSGTGLDLKYTYEGIFKKSSSPSRNISKKSRSTFKKSSISSPSFLNRFFFRNQTEDTRKSGKLVSLLEKEAGKWKKLESSSYPNAGVVKLIENNPSKQDLTTVDIICLSGCRDNQTSSDAEIEGLATGALTYAYLLSLARHGFKKELEFLPLLKTITIFLKEQNYSQIPQLSSGKKLSVQSPISFM